MTMEPYLKFLSRQIKDQYMNKTIKIGIVDDELIIAEKTKSFLMSAGYEVCEPVPTYAEALVMIDEEAPDILLLDINLNDKKDGIDS